MFGDTGRGYRLVEDRHFVNVPIEPVARTVEDSAAADMDVVE